MKRRALLVLGLVAVVPLIAVDPALVFLLLDAESAHAAGERRPHDDRRRRTAGADPVHRRLRHQPPRAGVAGRLAAHPGGAAVAADRLIRPGWGRRGVRKVRCAG
ncbi:hypothetical protein G5V59_24725 [Nocardioides sp. W3-2-3]|uniref:hypothetical protein n=1 Tax=Nocardioides convexus TaxID=2712224 RepID=UPI0024184BB7|nr:hypothetical protein [Nocardioides convexus]NHA01806.1 hypothetical protein [Nocardioides convexus]